MRFRGHSELSASSTPRLESLFQVGGWPDAHREEAEGRLGPPGAGRGRRDPPGACADMGWGRMKSTASGPALVIRCGGCRDLRKDTVVSSAEGRAVAQAGGEAACGAARGLTIAAAVSSGGWGPGSLPPGGCQRPSRQRCVLGKVPLSWLHKALPSAPKAPSSHDGGTPAPKQAAPRMGSLPAVMSPRPLGNGATPSCIWDASGNACRISCGVFLGQTVHSPQVHVGAEGGPDQNWAREAQLQRAPTPHIPALLRRPPPPPPVRKRRPPGVGARPGLLPPPQLG